jgi:RNA polymerase subunit RPABC4/transcription elongation factor Spt4
MKEQKEKKEQIFCPYCEDEIMSAELPFCQSCNVTMFYCPQCRKPVPRDKKTCPHCGAEIRG